MIRQALASWETGAPVVADGLPDGDALACAEPGTLPAAASPAAVIMSCTRMRARLQLSLRVDTLADLAAPLLSLKVF